MSGRPTREAANAAVQRFLEDEGIECDGFNLVEAGDDGWAFWIGDNDTTSYVRRDLSIEWLGTTVE